MAELSIHDVTKIEVKEIDCHKRSGTGDKFYVRHLVIRDSKGGKYEVTMYSDEREGLKLKLKEGA